MDNYGNHYPEFPPGETRIEVLPEFDWPDELEWGRAIWYAAITDLSATRLIGNIGTFTFYFYPEFEN